MPSCRQGEAAESETGSPGEREIATDYAVAQDESREMGNRDEGSRDSVRQHRLYRAANQLRLIASECPLLGLVTGVGAGGEPEVLTTPNRDQGELESYLARDLARWPGRALHHSDRGGPDNHAGRRA